MKAQAPYPPPVNSPTDDLTATAFLASKQRNTLGNLPKGVKHPVAALLQRYVEEGIPDHTGPPWLTEALETAISKGARASYNPH